MPPLVRPLTGLPFRSRRPDPPSKERYTSAGERITEQRYAGTIRAIPKFSSPVYLGYTSGRPLMYPAAVWM